MKKNTEQITLSETIHKKQKVLVFFCCIFSILVITIYCYATFLDHEAKAPIEQIQGYYLGANINQYPELVSTYDADASRIWPSYQAPLNYSKPERKIYVYASSVNNLIYKVKLSLTFRSKESCDTSRQNMLEALEEKYQNTAFGSSSRYTKNGKTLYLNTKACHVNNDTYTYIHRNRHIIEMTILDPSVKENVIDILDKRIKNVNKDESDNALIFINEALADKNTKKITR